MLQAYLTDSKIEKCVFHFYFLVCKEYLHSCHSQGCLQVRCHPKWNLLRDSQSFTLLEAHIVVNMDYLTE